MTNINWESSWIKNHYMDSETVKMGDSPYSLYEWYAKDCKGGKTVFYVGFGKNFRFNNKAARSKEFNRVIKENLCDVRIIAYGMTESKARELEKEYILKRHEEGCPLVNKQYIIDFYHTPTRLEFMKRLHERLKQNKAREKTNE